MFKTKIKSKLRLQNLLVQNEDIKLQTTPYCTKSLMVFASILGIFPVGGLIKDNPDKYTFKYMSIKMVHTVLLIIGTSFCCVLSAWKSLHNKMIMHRLISPLFYLHITGTTIISLTIAKKWAILMDKIYKQELIFLRKYKAVSHLKAKISIVTLIATLFITCEHALAIANFTLSADCVNKATGFEHYVRKQYHYVYNYFDYNIFNGLLLLIISWTTAYIWNFGDLAIISISIIYTSRFNQITEKINSFVNYHRSRKNILSINSQKMGENPDKFWKDIRRDYTKMCRLCLEVNEMIGLLISFTYTCNIFFILVQLFVSLRPREQLVERLYFICSFSYVITRILLSSIYGGWLYESGKASLPVLNALPSELYTVEVPRLINQMHLNSPTLTGQNFFTVSKGLVLSIAASVITYELVIMQFNQNEHDQYLVGINITICY